MLGSVFVVQVDHDSLKVGDRTGGSFRDIPLADGGLLNRRWLLRLPNTYLSDVGRRSKYGADSQQKSAKQEERGGRELHCETVVHNKGGHTRTGNADVVNEPI